MNFKLSIFLFAGTVLFSANLALSGVFYIPPESNCALSNISLSDLTGSWYLTHHNDPNRGSYQMIVTQLDENNIHLNYYSFGVLVNQIDLKLNDYYQNLLQTVYLDSWSANVRWYILALSPDNYLTLFTESFLDSPKEYAVLSRNNTLDNSFYEDATSGLMCTKSYVDEAEFPQVYQLY